MDIDTQATWWHHMIASERVNDCKTARRTSYPWSRGIVPIFGEHSAVLDAVLDAPRRLRRCQVASWTASARAALPVGMPSCDHHRETQPQGRRGARSQLKYRKQPHAKYRRRVGAAPSAWLLRRRRKAQSRHLPTRWVAPHLRSNNRGPRVRSQRQQNRLIIPRSQIDGSTPMTSNIQPKDMCSG
jgi:hypothetical protein